MSGGTGPNDPRNLPQFVATANPAAAANYDENTLNSPRMDRKGIQYVTVAGGGGTGVLASVIDDYIDSQAGAALNALVTAAVVSGPDPADGNQIAQASVGDLGSTFDGDTAGINGLIAISPVYAFDPANNIFTPIPLIDMSLGTVQTGINALAVAAFSWGYNGSENEQFVTASADNLSALSGLGAQITTRPGEWAITHTPGANTQATITRAAGAAGVRHVCTSISATLIGLAAAAEATVLVNLRDGATGAGTILQSWRLLVVGGSGSETGIALTGLSIPGSAATAMTLEFAAAGGANTFETVSLAGFDAEPA